MFEKYQNRQQSYPLCGRQIDSKYCGFLSWPYNNYAGNTQYKLPREKGNKNTLLFKLEKHNSLHLNLVLSPLSVISQYKIKS